MGVEKPLTHVSFPFNQWTDGSSRQGPVGNKELLSVWQHWRQLVSQLRSGKDWAPPTFVLHFKSWSLDSWQINTTHLTILMLNTSSRRPFRLSPALHSRHIERTMLRAQLMHSLAKRLAWTYQRCWMFWHLWRTSKHSSSIEHAPKSSPTPLSPTELHTKARASMSSGSSRMFRSSSVGLVDTKCRASSWLWHSWIQWHSSNIWEA